MECLKDKSASYAPSRLRVLLIEEDEFTRAIIRLALRGSNYRLDFCEVTSDGSSATERLKPDIIIADSSSSAGATLNLLDSLKSNPDTSGIPIILLKPDTVSSDSDRDLKADFTIAKPFKVSHLLAGLAFAEAMRQPSPIHRRSDDLMTTEFFRW
jgi:CheY-like chemotaxis protein